MRPFLVEDAEDFGVTPAVPDQRGVPVSALVGHAELAQHPGRCHVAWIAGRIDPVQSYQPKPSAEKFPADDCAHASPPHPRMHEIGDLALAVGQVTDLQLADTDEFTVEAGRIHESCLRGMQPGIHRALDEVPRLSLGVRPPYLVAASLRQAGEGMYSVAVTDNELAHSHRGFDHEPILSGQLVIPAAEYRDSLPDWHHPVYDELMA